MSREFGSYESGYFHTQMSIAARDCLAGQDELTRLWGEFFHEFEDVAYAIASSEAADSSVAFPIMENLQKMKALKDKLNKIEKYLEPFRRVADEAVRNHLKAAGNE